MTTMTLNQVQSFIYLITFPTGADFSFPEIEADIGNSNYNLVID